jgi:hypothetical protein
MSSIDPRAEAARRGAEEARRAGARTSAEDLARAVELAKGMASALDPANARGAPELAWILRGYEALGPEAQRVFLASAAGAGVGDSTAARAAEGAQAVSASIRQAFPPGSGRWVKLGEALARLQGRSIPGMRAEASAAVASEAVARLAGETSRPAPPRAAPGDVVERGGGAGRFGELLRQAQTARASGEAPASESPDGQALSAALQPVTPRAVEPPAVVAARAVTGPGVKLVG